MTDATVLPDKTVALLTELLVVYEIIDFMKTSGSGRSGDGDRAIKIDVMIPRKKPFILREKTKDIIMTPQTPLEAGEEKGKEKKKRKRKKSATFSHLLFSEDTARWGRNSFLSRASFSKWILCRQV